MSEQQINRAIEAAAKEVGAKASDMQGYYEAGGDWDADTVESLTDLLVTCWTEQEQQA